MLIDSAALKELVSVCPSLEQLDLRSLGTITSLELSGVGNLKRANVELNTVFHKIALVGAASLEFFTCSGDIVYFVRPPVFDIKLEGCEASLKELRLSYLNLSTEWVQIQISKSRNLKVLALDRIIGLTMLKISSTELTDVVLERLPELDLEPEIYAPNLRKLEIRGSKYVFNSLVTSRSLESVNFEFGYETDADHKTILLGKVKELFRKINHINNVVVCFACYRPKILIVHEGPSEDLLDKLSDLYDSMSEIVIIISSDLNWVQHAVLPSWANRIYIASPHDNNRNHLSEGLVRPTHRRPHRPFQFGSRYVESIALEDENDKSEFIQGVDTNHALLEVYRGSSFKFTRFVLSWSNTH